MKDYQWIYQHVLERFGDARLVEEQLPIAKTAEQLLAIKDNEYLSLMTRRIFRAGLKHALVDAKWPAFEQAFFDFMPARVAMMSDDQLDLLMGNRAIIRHWQKIKATPANAAMVIDVSRQHGSFGEWMAAWPETDIVGLWTFLKKNGVHLGGDSAAAFLRMVGKDTFRLTEDVVVALKAQGIVDKKPTSQRDLKTVQLAFNRWHEQSGRPLCQLSRLLAMTVNY